MKLVDLTVENQPFRDLVNEYYKKVKTLNGIIAKEDFIKDELERVKTVYIKPIEVSLTPDSDFRIVSSLDFTKYTKTAYEWLKSGYDVEVQSIIDNAKQENRQHIYDEELFEKSILQSLRRGVGIVLYEQFLKKESNSDSMPSKMKEVLITYSWDSKEHQEKAISLTEFLRIEGFDAEIDVKLTQEESAIDFIKMMHKGIKLYQRIIIILSSGYKEKAEVFDRGVGVEYRLILADIDKNPKKYILLSLEPMSDDIIPLGMQGREIVDMTLPDSHEKLKRKLLDAPKFQFSEVGSKKPALTSRKVEPFRPVIPRPLTIERIFNDRCLAWTQGGMIKELKIPCRINIKNEGANTVNDANLEVTMPRNILDGELEYSIFGDNIVVNFGIKKVFAGQLLQGAVFQLKIRNTNADVINKTISVKVFSEEGSSEEVYVIKDFVRYEDSYSKPKQLSEEMFLPPWN